MFIECNCVISGAEVTTKKIELNYFKLQSTILYDFTDIHRYGHNINLYY